MRVVDVTPENEAASSAAAGILLIRLDSFPIPPVTIPSMPDVLIAGNVRETKRARLVCAKYQKAESNNRSVYEESLGIGSVYYFHPGSIFFLLAIQLITCYDEDHDANETSY